MNLLFKPGDLLINDEGEKKEVHKIIYSDPPGYILCWQNRDYSYYPLETVHRNWKAIL